MKKVIVTGASGFIGYNVLKKLLSYNIEVIAIVREHSKNLYKLKDKKITIIECNLDNVSMLPQMIKDRDIDTLYHFAWQGVFGDDLKKESTQIANLTATLTLIDVAAEMGINTFIGAGSLHEQEAIVEMNENKIINNMGIMYKTAKLAAHYMAKSKAGNLGIRFFWPIITNTYGEGENSGRLINTIIRKIFIGEVPLLSEGKQNYDFVHIDDVANAFYLIGEMGVDGSNYIIGSGNTKPLKEYLQLVGDIANYRNNSNIALGFGRVKNNVIFLSKDSFDTHQLIKDTGFMPHISFEEGIRKTVDWIYDSNKENKLID